MTVKGILLLGNPKLYEVSHKVKKEELEDVKSIVKNLQDTLGDFRKKYASGRAISSPQIGVMKQIIYMHIPKPTVLINPEITFKSDETFEVWDDCMSFSNILVKVKRHKKIKVKYLDLNWKKQTLTLEDDLSELIQHEIDHLHGILAFSKAVDDKSFALKSQKHFLKTK